VTHNIITAGVCLAIIAVLCPERPYLFDLLANTAKWWGLLGVGAIAIPMLRCRWREAGGTGLFVLSLFLVLVLWVPGQDTRRPTRLEASQTDGLVRAVCYNARGSLTRDHARFAQWVLAEDVDLVSVVEAPLKIADGNLKSRFENEFPHSARAGGRPGFKVYSRWPIGRRPLNSRSALRHAELAWLRPFRVEAPVPFNWVATHLASPRSSTVWKRALHVATVGGRLIAKKREDWSEPFIVAGDFNSTPAGRVFREFKEHSGLAVAVERRCPGGTWPSVLPSAVSLRIDHVWVDPKFELRRIEVGPRFESDHRPVTVEFQTIRLAESAASVRGLD